MTFKNPTYAQSSRKPWADLCRVVAIFGVILIHVSGVSFDKYSTIVRADWIGVTLLDSFVRGAVPIFVMLSGALLLKSSQPSVSVQIISKRVLRVLIPLIVWGTGYLAYVAKTSIHAISWTSLFSEAPMYHLWFAYMIIGLYLILPVLDAIFQYIVDRRELQMYLFALWVLVSSVPIYWPIKMLGLLQLTSLLGYGGYFIIGGIIVANSAGKIPTWLWAAIYAFGVAATTVLTIYFTNMGGVPSETARAQLAPNILVTSISAFILFTRVNFGKTAAELLERASDLSFMVFFMHVLVIQYVVAFLAPVTSNIPCTISDILISLVTLAVSLTIAALIRLIPWSRRLFG